jgi:arabinose-5-phosphate isomerase
MATMGMGDALAVALINARDFKPTDFAMFHPGGSLGKKLLTQVRDVMKTNVPTVRSDTSVHECLFVMTSGRLGLAVIIEDKQPKGIITDGDLRRAMLKDNDVLQNPVLKYANLNPVTVTANTKLSDAEKLMRSKKISAVIVMGERGGDEGVCGVLEIYS